MDSSDIIAVISIIVSVIALLYTYFTNTKPYELSSLYRTEILKWYADTVTILITLKTSHESYCHETPAKCELLSKLSSQIEIGRFYFPNTDKGDRFGLEKPTAYQGYRNAVLDFLVFSHQLFERNDAKKYLHHAEILQRYFTSLLFEIVEPKKFLEETRKLTSKTFSRELSFEDFIRQEPEIIRQYI